MQVNLLESCDLIMVVLFVLSNSFNLTVLMDGRRGYSSININLIIFRFIRFLRCEYFLGLWRYFVVFRL